MSRKSRTSAFHVLGQCTRKSNAIRYRPLQSLSTVFPFSGMSPFSFLTVALSAYRRAELYILTIASTSDA